MPHFLVSISTTRRVTSRSVIEFVQSAYAPDANNV